jgi:hypothetical protein
MGATRQVSIEGSDGVVRALALKRKYLETLALLGAALHKALPEGVAPSVAQLEAGALKAKYTARAQPHEAGDALSRHKLELNEPSALCRAAREAHELYLWPRKTK